MVLIHGFGGDLNNWLFTQPALAETHRVIALDLPGHGGSSKDVGAGDLATFSRKLAAFLDVLDIPTAHLVGHSLGGACRTADRARASGTRRLPQPDLPRRAGRGDRSRASRRISSPPGRRKQMQPVLEKLFVDKSLVRSEMTEDLLKFKRLDGAQVGTGGDRHGELRQRPPERGLGRAARRARQYARGGDLGAEDQIIPARHADRLAQEREDPRAARCGAHAAHGEGGRGQPVIARPHSEMNDREL